MAAAENDRPLIHSRVPNDPLSAFVTEELDGTEWTQGTTQLTSGISAQAHPIMASPDVERATRRQLSVLWLVGAAMLVVGLLAGYAAGVATATRNVEGQNASGRSLPTDRAASAPQPPEFQSRVRLSSIELIAEAGHDELRTTKQDSRPPQPQSIDSRPPRSPLVDTVPATGPGVLHLESRPTGAQVHLDDRLVATTPFRLYGVPPGSHTVRMELQGYQPWSMSVNVEAGSRGRISASLEQ